VILMINIIFNCKHFFARRHKLLLDISLSS
jgi:hypothetical protein